jgi:hypothetical protein
VLSLLAAAAALLLMPDEVYRAAGADLAQRPPAKRRVTRYLSLHAVPAAERWKFVQAIDFAINSTSFRTQIVHPELVGNDRLLYRLDLEDLGWDRESRAARRARLKLAGVDFRLAGEAERLFDDAWEAFVARDPYWKVTHEERGKVVRGWLNPVVEEATRYESQSANFVLRADWLLPRLLTEDADGGFYSKLLMLPATEADLYKVFGIDIALVNRDSQLKVGGGVLESVVARHPRHLRFVPSMYGFDERFVTLTFDFADERGDDKDLFKRPGGNLRHDGREIIGSLPNGLHWYYLADGKGKQVAVVPQAIALDQRPDGAGKIRDRNVVNAIKCIDCHGETAGIRPFIDVERQAMLDPNIALLVKSRDKRRLAEITQSLEDYYLLAERGGIEARVVRQQESYARRVLAVNELSPEDNAQRVLDWYNRYVWDLVRPEQAAAEMGLPLDAPADGGPPRGARAAWRLSGNDELVVLSSGQAIRRAAWEGAFRDAMEALVFPWETAVKLKVGH